MKNLIFKSLLLVGISTGAQAHDVWINPGSFEINSDTQTTYSLDVARSAEAFIAEANHDIKVLNVVSPSGKQSKLSAAFSGTNKEVFEQDFTETGTYHFRSPITQVFLTFYRDAEGKKHKVSLPKRRYHELPANIEIEKTVEKQMITEAYISYNGFSDVQIQQQAGITVSASKHPNQFTVGDKVSFTASFENKPLAGAEFAIKSSNRIYDADLEDIKIIADKNGKIEFTPTTSGRYILGVEHEITLTNDKDADQRSVELFLSFDIVK